MQKNISAIQITFYLWEFLVSMKQPKNCYWSSRKVIWKPFILACDVYKIVKIKNVVTIRMFKNHCSSKYGLELPNVFLFATQCGMHLRDSFS